MTMAMTPVRLAPSAMRMPISLVRRATAKAVTPYKSNDGEQESQRAE